ncbi:MAG: hypothetical protein HGA87_04910 [Desulfobulbaceae bacterium]|nr:hypothetical protein [Desulfobulbaceae bacterium]
MPDTLTGKYFDPRCMQGYIQSATGVFGVPRIKSFFHIPIRELPISPDKKQQLFDVLAPYFRHDHTEPVDYRVVSWLYLSLERDLQYKEKSVQFCARKIGQLWWNNESSAPYQPDTTSFRVLVGDAILEETTHRLTESHPFPGAPVSPDRIALQRLIAYLQQTFHLAITRIDTPASIAVEVHECPLCLHEKRAGTCTIWYGLWEGFLDWVHHSPSFHTFVPTLQINSSATNDHTFVFTIFDNTE